MLRLSFALVAVFLLFQRPALAETQASDRVALVIGMAAYETIPPLKNTLNDARALAETLEGIGFRVDVLMNAPRDEVLAKLEDFAFQAETADLALIYYAGHGVSVQGTTFLIPVDAQVTEARDIVTEAVTMGQMEAAIGRARKMSVLILDSCRDNPFPEVIDLRDPEVAEGLTTGVGGLAAPSPERGTLVAFAARDGAVALDGSGENSPFNEALRRHMVEPDLEIGILFRRVRDDVLAMTGNRQEPTTYGSLPGEPFFLAGGNAAGAVMGVEDLAMAWSKIAAEDAAQMQLLAEAGDTRSIVGLALSKLDRQEKAYDPAAAVALLEQAVAAGDPEAKYRLAKVLEGGFGVPADPARALALYTEAAAADVPGAVNDMGFFHFFGDLGLAKDEGKALELFIRAAQLGHGEAMFNVASYAANGRAPGLGARDAADLLYRALRGGSELALNGLLQNADKFPAETWKELQQILADNGLYGGPVDGQFGPGTRRSVLAAYGIFEVEE
jgi:TPR repeat protein